MQEDSTFKERFGISTSITYVSNVLVEPSSLKKYERSWKIFSKKIEPVGSIARRLKFDSFLKKIEKQGDDLAFTDSVEIRYINDKVGYGVFAKKNIRPHAILNHYAGILKPDKTIPESNDSAFMFSDFPTFTIDAQTSGNWCRFMNHGEEKSKTTNVFAWEHYSKWGPRIIFTAGKKGIKKGEQLLYSYGDSYWEENNFMEL